MNGLIEVKKRYLMASGAVTWFIPIMYPAPWLATILSLFTAGLIGGFIFRCIDLNIIAMNTKKVRVKAPNFQNWTATIREDLISDPDYVCVYRVFFTVSHDEIETKKEDGTITFSGNVKRTQDGDVRTTEIYSEWIGKNGELSTGNVWKNVFATAIKRNYAGNISVVSCGYLRQEHI